MQQAQIMVIKKKKGTCLQKLVHLVSGYFSSTLTVPVLFKDKTSS